MAHYSVKIFRGVGHTMLTIINLMVLILLGGALLCRYISPATMVLPAYLGLAFPLLLLGVLLFAFLWFCLRRRGRGGINLVMLLAALPAALLYCPMRREQPRPVGEEWLKVVSLNVHAFRFQELGANGYHSTTDYLSKTEADIICLQEGWLSPNSSKYMSERSLRNALKQYPYYSSAYAAKDHGSRLIVLSKYPILASRPIDLHSDFNGGAVFTIQIGERRLILYNLHLESFKLTESDQQTYIDLMQGGDAQALTQAIGSKFSPSFQTRAKQVEQVYQDIHYRETPYLIVCGDFNDTPISYTHARLSAGLHDAIRTAGSGLNYSYRLRGRIGLRIDHMLYSDSIEARAAHVDSSAGISDHKPIICYFKLR